MNIFQYQNKFRDISLGNFTFYLSSIGVSVMAEEISEQLDMQEQTLIELEDELEMEISRVIALKNSIDPELIDELEKIEEGLYVEVKMIHETKKNIEGILNRIKSQEESKNGLDLADKKTLEDDTVNQIHKTITGRLLKEFDATLPSWYPSLKQLLFKMPIKTPYPQELPDKLYFKIGEVSELLGIPTYVLRFWETEFKRIKPKRTSSGQRLYRHKDLELILKIKHLLYDKRYTIPGAKLHLRAKKSLTEDLPKTLSVDEIRQELLAIRKLL